VRFVVCVVGSLAVVGCGGRRMVNVMPPAQASGEQAAPAQPPPSDSLETFIAKVRKLSIEARPDRPKPTTVEGSSPRLMAALAAAMAMPTPVTYRTIGEEYRALGIFDKAHDYFNKAMTMDPRDAATHDAFARLWRDAGFANLALGDAYRAVYYAPASAAAHNTLGTIFQALGRRADARKQYETALQLDPTAAYALNNLCYGWVLDGDAGKAIPACERALRIDPGLATARNNLGLAHAVAGDLNATRSTFDAAGDHATALYNMGIVHLARRHYSSAVQAFDAAQVARPNMRMAADRARQALTLSKTNEE
jgi:tetratricopeptide (TPR) repeat protein